MKLQQFKHKYAKSFFATDKGFGILCQEKDRCYLQVNAQTEVDREHQQITVTDPLHLVTVWQDKIYGVGTTQTNDSVLLILEQGIVVNRLVYSWLKVNSLVVNQAGIFLSGRADGIGLLLVLTHNGQVRWRKLCDNPCKVYAAGENHVVLIEHLATKSNIHVLNSWGEPEVAPHTVNFLVRDFFHEQNQSFLMGTGFTHVTYVSLVDFKPSLEFYNEDFTDVVKIHARYHVGCTKAEWPRSSVWTLISHTFLYTGEETVADDVFKFRRMPKDTFLLGDTLYYL